MGKAKEIVLKVIPASIANPFIRAHHYSGGVVTNSCLAMQFADEMLAKDPNNTFYLYVKGYLYHNMKDYDKSRLSMHSRTYLA